MVGACTCVDERIVATDKHSAAASSSALSTHAASAAPDRACDIPRVQGDNTALHWASMRGHVEIVKFLVQVLRDGFWGLKWGCTYICAGAKTGAERLAAVAAARKRAHATVRHHRALLALLTCRC